MNKKKLLLSELQNLFDYRHQLKVDIDDCGDNNRAKINLYSRRLMETENQIFELITDKNDKL